MEKIRIHSQIQKAERLEKLMQQFLGKDHDELKFTVISLLCLLSKNPLDSNYFTMLPISIHLNEFQIASSQINAEFSENELKELYNG